ncbi:MAG: response regulator transcription factor [Stappiaceae bacterium]
MSQNPAFSADPIRILLADDHELVRDGIRARLESTENFSVIGEATNGEEAVELALKLKPDLIMLDVSMPLKNGLDVAREIRARNADARILILSIYDNPEYVRGAMHAGANGYLLKDVSAADMISAITSVASGGYYFSSQIAPTLMGLETKSVVEDPYGLTEREREVLGAVAKGMSNKETAKNLNISVRTVESHRLNIRDKVGGGNAAHLARIAQELDLL